MNAAVPARLLSPESAAAYLGLGSRWAVYRLVGSGSLRAVKLAGKMRIDRADLDAFIEALKRQDLVKPTTGARHVVSVVPQGLVPFTGRNTTARPVTIPVTASSRAV